PRRGRRVRLRDPLVQGPADGVAQRLHLRPVPVRQRHRLHPHVQDLLKSGICPATGQPRPVSGHSGQPSSPSRTLATAHNVESLRAEVFMSISDKSIHDKKNKSIGEAIRAIHKQFGSGSIMRLDGSEVQPVEVIATGSGALDVALGCGGLPRGRIIEIYGPESSGKTTLTLHAIAEAQRYGGVCAFIDAEHALD